MSKDNAIQVFNHPQFGSINTVETEYGKVLFRANDVAKALGYVETAKAVRTHCKEVCRKAHLFFMHKAPTFTSQGFVVS